MSNEAEVADVVVVGSGIGGLTTASLLARLGQRVVVVEANKEPGGLLRSYSRQGIDCPLGVHYFGAAGEGELLAAVFELLGVREDLRLERLGRDSTLDRYTFRGRSFDLPGSFAALPDALARSFPGERAAIGAVVAALREASRTFTLEGPRRNGGDPILGNPLEPADVYYARLGCSPALIEALGVPAVWLGSRVTECPAPLHLMTLASFVLSSWRLGCTGAEMADLYATRLVAAGGTLLNRRRVTRLLVTDGRASGVALASGEEIRARRVIAAVHPKQVLAWLPEAHRDPDQGRRIAALPESRSAVCVQALVDARLRGPTPFHHYRIADEATRWPVLFAQVRPCERPARNLVTLIAAEHFQRWERWDTSSTGKRGREYRAHKGEVARELLAAAEEVLGSLAGAEVIDCYTPLSVRDWVSVPEGGLYGVVRTADSMLPLAALQRTLLPGLRLVGQSAAAPGLLGVTLGALRVVGDVVGRETLRRALEGRAAA